MREFDIPYRTPPWGGGVSARNKVFKPILAKISVHKHLNHVPWDGLGGRRRRPKLDKFGRKTKELKVFLCVDTLKTSSFCAPHGATIRLSIPDAQSTKRSQTFTREPIRSVRFSFSWTQCISLCPFGISNHCCPQSTLDGGGDSNEERFHGFLLYDPFVISFAKRILRMNKQNLIG